MSSTFLREANFSHCALLRKNEEQTAEKREGGRGSMTNTSETEYFCDNFDYV